MEIDSVMHLSVLPGFDSLADLAILPSRSSHTSVLKNSKQDRDMGRQDPPLAPE